MRLYHPKGLSRSIAFVIAFLWLAPTLSAQEPRSPRDPRRLPTIDLGGIRLSFFAVNDEACPIQIKGGRANKRASEGWSLSLAVKALTDEAIDRYQFDVFVYETDGHFNERLEVRAGKNMPPRRDLWVDLPLPRRAFTKDNVIVVAVREVRSANLDWQSIRAEVQSTAQMEIKRRQTVATGPARSDSW